jgi:hypothetical protein
MLDTPKQHFLDSVDNSLRASLSRDGRLSSVSTSKSDYAGGFKHRESALIKIDFI